MTFSERQRHAAVEPLRGHRGQRHLRHRLLRLPRQRHLGPQQRGRPRVPGQHQPDGQQRNPGGGQQAEERGADHQEHLQEAEQGGAGSERRGTKSWFGPSFVYIYIYLFIF